MFLISYDIENDRLRLKVSKHLQRWGLHRVQYSVFMGNVEKQNFPKLRQELSGYAQRQEWTSTDSILIVPIHQGHLKSIEVFGSWPDRWEEITGEKNTLMI